MVGDFNDQDGAVVGDETRRVVEVDLMTGQTIGHGMHSTGLVRNFDGERVHQFNDKAFCLRASQAFSGSLTRNFITPNGPVLATATQRMLILAPARILVKWATCPGLFSAKAATILMSFIGDSFGSQPAVVNHTFGLAFTCRQRAGRQELDLRFDENFRA